MPVENCMVSGRPGFSWGKRGTCHTYTAGEDESRERARLKAERDGRRATAKDDKPTDTRVERVTV